MSVRYLREADRRGRAEIPRDTSVLWTSIGENRRESAMIFDGQNDSLLYYPTRSLFAVTPGSKGKSAHYESAAARRHTPHRPPRAFIQYDGGAGILSCTAAAHLA